MTVIGAITNLQMMMMMPGYATDTVFRMVITRDHAAAVIDQIFVEFSYTSAFDDAAVNFNIHRAYSNERFSAAH